MLSAAAAESVQSCRCHASLVEGTLEGFDTLNNLVLDQAEEIFPSGDKRRLGLLVVRCTAVCVICNADGMQVVDSFRGHEE